MKKVDLRALGTDVCFLNVIRYSGVLKIYEEKFYLSLDGIWRVGGYI